MFVDFGQNIICIGVGGQYCCCSFVTSSIFTESFKLHDGDMIEEHGQCSSRPGR